MERNVVRSLFLVLVFLLPVLAGASVPDQIWIVSLKGTQTIENAWEVGALVFDRAPGLLVIGDRQSAAKLEEAGFLLEGPIVASGLDELVLLYPGEGHVDHDSNREEIVSTYGDLLLWSDGRNAIIRMDEAALFRAELAGLHVLSLRDDPVRPIRPREEDDRARQERVPFDPLIDGMVAKVDSAKYMKWIGDLSGEQEVIVGGQPLTFWTRWTANVQCDSAEQFVYEQFQAMGYTDVRYDTFNLLSQESRNVVATLPGTTTPENIYIICGHLDSRSFNMNLPAPGANDNASGIAVVMSAAEIMRQYEFNSTIRFLAVTGEEQGLVGSSRYAARAAANGDNIVAVINLDMVAWDVGTYSIDIQGGTGLEWLMQEMADACAQYTGLGTTQLNFSGGSDHVSFQNEGFAAILGIQDEYSQYGCYHRSCDLIGQNDWQMGTDVTRASIAAIADLAGVTGVVTHVAATAPPHRALFLLDNPRPNPFNPTTRIRFQLSEPSTVDLALFDARGRLVQTLLRGSALGAGSEEILWNGKDDKGRPVSSGVYFCKMMVAGDQQVRRLTLIR